MITVDVLIWCRAIRWATEWPCSRQPSPWSTCCHTSFTTHLSSSASKLQQQKETNPYIWILGKWSEAKILKWTWEDPKEKRKLLCFASSILFPIIFFLSIVDPLLAIPRVRTESSAHPSLISSSAVYMLSSSGQKETTDPGTRRSNGSSYLVNELSSSDGFYSPRNCKTHFQSSLQKKQSSIV